jgi:hypothetical protein
MNTLEKFDKFTKKKCCVLSPTEQIRSGFKRRTDLKKAIKGIGQNPEYARDGGGVLLGLPLEDAERLLMKDPSFQRIGKLEREDPLRPAPSTNINLDSTDDLAEYAQFIYSLQPGSKNISGTRPFENTRQREAEREEEDSDFDPDEYSISSGTDDDVSLESEDIDSFLREPEENTVPPSPPTREQEKRLTHSHPPRLEVVRQNQE